MSAGNSQLVRRSLARSEYTFVISCFFDDSGTESQKDHRHVVLAGYIGPDETWGQFFHSWRHLLLRHGIPAVHMKSWLKTAKEKEWSTAQRNDVLAEFIELIQKSKLIGFGVGVDADFWRALPADRRKAFGSAQEFCCQRILRLVIDRIDASNLNDDISLIFDQDFEFARPRLRLLEHLYKTDPRIRGRVTQISFASSRVFYQLQAADILAWHARRHLYTIERHES